MSKRLTAFHISEWHEDAGGVLWWHPGEAPYVGSPLDVGKTVALKIIGASDPFLDRQFQVGGWPGYHEWWTPLPDAPEIPEQAEPLDRKDTPHFREAADDDVARIMRAGRPIP